MSWIIKTLAPSLKLLLIYATMIVAGVLFSLSAEAARFHSQGRSWNQLFISGPLTKNKRWHYHLDIQARFADENSPLRQGIIRPFISYRLSKMYSVALGYASVPTVRGSATVVRFENRIWQQLLLHLYDSNTFRMSLRNRFEQRKFEEDKQWAMRFRSMFRVKWPNYFHHKFSPILYDEVFFNVTHPQRVSNKAFSQNRLFVGIGFHIHKHTQLIIGYLNQLLFGRDRLEDNHVLALSLEITHV